MAKFIGFFYDLVYVVVAIFTAPIWLRKTRSGWAERFGRVAPLAPPDRPRLLIHAVSVGEVNLIRPLVETLANQCEIVVSSTTDTGLARAEFVFSEIAHVRRYPLDASFAVGRFLDATEPHAVALAELELWPNFLRACGHRGVPVAVVNGRLSSRSFGGYRRLRPVLSRYFRGLAFACVQDTTYAERFKAMGVPANKAFVTGTMKWDAATIGDAVAGADGLARELGIDLERPLIVAGSTAPDEHALLHEATPAGVQLLCAPRKPEWADAAARDLPGCVRRTDPTSGDASSDRFLLDTIGELRAAYALADLVVIGRSFGELFGSDPMEPAALGRPIVIGPRVADFQTTVEAMLAEDAIVQVAREGLGGVLGDLMADAERRATLAGNARACVVRHQGATERTARLLLDLLPSPA